MSADLPPIGSRVRLRRFIPEAVVKNYGWTNGVGPRYDRVLVEFQDVARKMRWFHIDEIEEVLHA